MVFLKLIYTFIREVVGPFQNHIVRILIVDADILAPSEIQRVDMCPDLYLCPAVTPVL